MTLAKAIALGVLQALTEFLPVSSSGHLALAQQLFPGGIEDSLAFDVWLHFGTLLAVLVYFRRDLAAMTRSLFGSPPEDAPYLRDWIFRLGVATLPIAVVGLTMKDHVEQAFTSTVAVGIGLLLTAGLLTFASRRSGGRRGGADVSWLDALAIGCFQAVAIWPGISRSGSTIAGALGRGLDRTTAARFAFLLAIPAIAGAMVGHLDGVGTVLATDPAAVISGTAAAAVTGWVAVDVMMRVVRLGRLMPFALYCSVLGLAAVATSLL
jgi:undecaprenyl-diphosphatase